MNVKCIYRKTTKHKIESRQLVYSDYDYIQLNSRCSHPDNIYNRNNAEIKNILVCHDCLLRKEN